LGTGATAARLPPAAPNGSDPPEAQARGLPGDEARGEEQKSNQQVAVVDVDEMRFQTLKRILDHRTGVMDPKTVSRMPRRVKAALTRCVAMIDHARQVDPWHDYSPMVRWVWNKMTDWVDSRKAIDKWGDNLSAPHEKKSGLDAFLKRGP
jgi:hypothetical protein